MEFVSRCLNDTRQLGAQAASRARLGDIYSLVGGIGVGKTEFVRGFVASIRRDAPVRSPSFTLLNVYETPLFPVYHFDFYRLGDVSELIEIGFDDYLSGQGVCLIEWADMFSAQIPVEGQTVISFTDTGIDSRLIRFSTAH